MATNNSINAPLPLTADKGGTGLVSPLLHGILIGQGPASMDTVELEANEFLLGTAADPLRAILTEGDGISITIDNGPTPSTVTIASTVIPGGLTWNKVTGTAETLAPNNALVTRNAAQTTYTLPATAILGDTYLICARAGNVGGWKLVPGTATQQIQLGTGITTLSSGYITNNDDYDVATIACIDADTSGSEFFEVISFGPASTFNVF